jgi:hypothetical protein
VQLRKEASDGLRAKGDGHSHKFDEQCRARTDHKRGAREEDRRGYLPCGSLAIGLHRDAAYQRRETQRQRAMQKLEGKDRRAEDAAQAAEHPIRGARDVQQRNDSYGEENKNIRGRMRE